MDSLISCRVLLLPLYAPTSKNGPMKGNFCNVCIDKLR